MFDSAALPGEVVELCSFSCSFTRVMFKDRSINYHRVIFKICVRCWLAGSFARSLVGWLHEHSPLFLQHSGNLIETSKGIGLGSSRIFSIDFQ